MHLDSLVPFLVAFAASAALSPAGTSGAFLLLPYQLSVLGLAGPAVTPTNHLFNVVATPAGIARYAKDGRLAWPLALVIASASLPGALLGSWLRMHALSDPSSFRVFVATILLLFGARLAWASFRPRASIPSREEDSRVEDLVLSPQAIEYSFDGVRYRAAVPLLAALSLGTGLAGGAAGIGGGSLLAPLLVTAFGLPLHSTAGATLFGTFATSFASVVAFGLLGGPADVPDWRLGLLLGGGGLCGTYLGAFLQRRVSARVVEGILAAGTLALAAIYLT